jgi:polysaccharide deacetylase 2 family uncharacterized protein YibQ
MAKRKKRGSKNSSKVLVYTAWLLAFVAFTMSLLVTGYYFGYADAKQEITKKEKIKQKKRADALKKLEKQALGDVNKRLVSVLKKEQKKKVKVKKIKKEPIGASHEFDNKKLINPPKGPSRTSHLVGQKPKLAIIIDDVCVRSHIEAIKALHIPITMSFLPPSAARPNSAKLASHEKFYMVHLPMEAMNWNKEEPYTLYAGDSQEVISKRIEAIKKLYPKVRYINNHTGSKFTASEVAVNRLINALNAQNIHFIDSRTTADTKVPKVMKNYGLKYMARDVFLDHHSDKEYVKSQIKQAIRIAKSHGTAIAIGHPNANTLDAIKESKEFFRDIELVEVYKLY